MGILLLLGLVVLAGAGIDTSSDIVEDIDEKIDELGLEDVSTEGVDFTDEEEIADFVDDYIDSVYEWVDGVVEDSSVQQETPTTTEESYVVFDHALSGGDTDAHQAHNSGTLEYLDMMNDTELNFDENSYDVDLDMADFSSFGLDDIGTEENDTLSGTDINDILLGLSGDDLISSGDGNDLIWGGTGNDTITGDDGDDIIYTVDAYNSYVLANNIHGGNSLRVTLDNARSGEMGTDGDDVVNGGAGNDTILSAGDDTLSGGEGSDMFLIGKVYEEDVVKITDYEEGELIVIYHSDSTGSPTIDWRIKNGDVTIRINGVDTVVLEDAEDVFDPWLIENRYDETIPVKGTEDIDFLSPQIVG